jgi:hypothetical protein
MVKYARGELVGANFVHRRGDVFKFPVLRKGDFEEPIASPEADATVQPPELVEEEGLIRRAVSSLRGGLYPDGQ